MDYTGNAKKNRGAEVAKAEKVIEKVVVGEVVIKKKPLGRKIRDLFIEADIRSVLRGVATDVLLPAARNMAYEAVAKATERTIFGDARGGSPYGRIPTRVSYNNPSRVHGGFRDPIGRSAPTPTAGPRSSRQSRGDIVLESRDEAAIVLERMNDIIDKYGVATVADLYELIGEETNHTDHKYGWVYLANAEVREVRGGFLLDIPPAEPVQ